MSSKVGSLTPLKVLIADDHPLMLVGLRRSLEGCEDFEIAGEARSGSELLALIERRRPDVVLMDLRMPDFDGEQSIEHIVTTWPEVKIVVLSACDDAASVNGALAAGAHTYVVKSASAPDITSVLRQIRCGAVFYAPSIGRVKQCEEPTSCADSLTERETAILAAIARGLTTKSISRELWVSEHTAKFHLTNIYRKLGVTNRSAAVCYAFEHGLTPTSELSLCG